MFRKDADFEAFERVMVETHLRQPLRILSYSVLSNHWHFVAWPQEDGQLTDYFRRLAHTHAMRWRVSHRTVGYGHLYQGRFKSFPVQSDDHLLSLLRYVERNPLSAGLVERAHLWRWGSRKRPVNPIFKTVNRRGIMFGAPSCCTQTRHA
jgi:putative transposase